MPAALSPSGAPSGSGLRPQVAQPSRLRRGLIGAISWGACRGAGWLAALPLASQAQPASPLSAVWPQWTGFVERFVQADGRVIDHATAEQHSTSEGQAYAMFFALAAGDRATFDRLWRWSQDNLLPEGLERQLPAWRWGRRPDGAWGVLDRNPASDADLWLAYTLLEAQRLWREPSFGVQCKLLLERIRHEEVLMLPRWGQMLLPGPKGFGLGPGRWRFNPSYSALPVLRRLAEVQPEGPWAEIATNAVRMIEATSPKGFAPDWAIYRARQGFELAGQGADDVGGYDAIRIYLWAGLCAEGDRLNGRLLRAVGGMAQALRQTGSIPERVEVLSGKWSGQGPPGFHAAVLPYLTALDEPLLRTRVEAMLDPKSGSLRDRVDKPWSYYDHVLALFGLGHAQRRFRFSPQGQLMRAVP